MDLDRLLQNQREYFRSGATLPVDFRIAMLKKLRDAVERHEEEIAAALKADLGKSDFEGFMCETGLVKSELSYMIRHTHSFASQRRDRQNDRGVLSAGVCGGRDRRPEGKRHLAGKEVRLDIFHRQSGRRSGSPSPCRRASDACRPGAWRQEPLHR